MSFNNPLFTIGIISACNDLVRYVNSAYYFNEDITFVWEASVVKTWYILAKCQWDILLTILAVVS